MPYFTDPKRQCKKIQGTAFASGSSERRMFAMTGFLIP
jgi:hypothetical protein